MAIWFEKGSMQGRQASVFADGASDVSNLDTFTQQNNLKAGSDCYVIGTGEVYMLDSEMNWKLQ